MENFVQLINGENPVLVDFFATWCGPCKMIHPILEEVKNKIGDRLKIVKVDIDKSANRRLVSAHNVQSVPTLILFKKGSVVWRQTGVLPADQLMKEIKAFI